MNVKTFSGDTTAEALKRVRDELGPEAMILETKRTARGIEVLAATERSGSRLTRPSSMSSMAASSGAERLRDDLIGQGFSTVLAERIAAAAQCNLDQEQLDDRRESLGYARELLALWLPRAPSLPRSGSRVLALVGAAGVGKTTTIAKLAAQEVLDGGRRVALASCDARRLGGVEALAAFARVLEVPFLQVKDRRDLDRARELAGRDGTLYLDTPGIPRHDRAAMDRLTEMLSGVRSDEIELLLAADMEGEAMTETVRRFGRLKPGSLGATRVDEALRPGTLLTALTRASLPLRHCGCGPDVPDDLTTPDGRQLAAWALPLPGEATSLPGLESA
jgi:flagellar biosynthesis protein FlhF